MTIKENWLLALLGLGRTDGIEECRLRCVESAENLRQAELAVEAKWKANRGRRLAILMGKISP